MPPPLRFARRVGNTTATLRFRSSCPLRSHTEVYLAVILDKSRCVNRFCNGKCSLVASFHSTQIFFRLVSSSVPQKFCGLPQNFCSTRETGAPENFVKLRCCIQFFLRLFLMIFIIIPSPPRALMTGQLFGSIHQKQSRKACPLRQKLVRFSPNQSKEATNFCLRQRRGEGIRKTLKQERLTAQKKLCDLISCGS